MKWPAVTVMVVTFDRPRLICETIAALQRYLQYKGQLHWHIADDGTSGDYVVDIERDFPSLDFTHTVTKRGGWGANVNAAMKYLGAEYIFLCEDDYKLRRVVDLTRGVALLQADESIGLVRYDGIAAHGERGLDLQLRSVRHDGMKIPHLRILKASPHINVYSNRPHLKHPRFHAAYGDYPTGLGLALTETTFARMVRGQKGPDIAVLPDYLFTPFLHVGKSRQRTDYDVGRKLALRGKSVRTRHGSRGRGKGGYARAVKRGKRV